MTCAVEWGLRGEKAMNKPSYREELFKRIFLWISIVFFVLGLLAFGGVLRPTTYSEVQEPNLLGTEFLAFGTVLLIVQTVLGGIVSRKKKLHNELLVNGNRINGTVEKVSVEMGVRYAGKTPYIVIYTFHHRGKAYHRESCFLWDKPDVMADDSIVVYINDSGKSTIQLG